jgi:hypothetical protein
VSKVSKTTFLMDPVPHWQIQCDIKKKTIGRLCLLNPAFGKHHVGNNCFLLLKPLSQSQMELSYRCMSGECKSCPNLVLGHFNFKNWVEGFTFDQRAVAEEEVPGVESTEISLDDYVGKYLTEDQAAAIRNKRTENWLDPAVDPKIPEENQYQQVCCRFESICFEVQEPKGFAIINQNKEFPQILNYQNIKNGFAYLTYWEQVKPNEWKLRPFITRWLQDPLHRSVKSIKVDPSMAKKRKRGEKARMWEMKRRKLAEMLGDII